VLEGTLKLRLGLCTIVARAGDTVVVPAGRVHKFRNGGDGPARARVEVAPALDMEDLLSTTAALADAGEVLDSGLPQPLPLALFVQRFRREVRAPSRRRGWCGPCWRRSRPWRGAAATPSASRP
jgi:hypothetical protein